MKRVREFLVSFIPRYVSNRVFLIVYQMLTVIPVSQKNREKNYNTNVKRLNNTDWEFWTVPSAYIEQPGDAYIGQRDDDYIENQSEWDGIMFGVGPHHNMRWSGCEIIATFNAMKVLTGKCSREEMAELIREYEKNGAALRGEFGVSPRAIETYFRKYGFLVTTTYKDDGQSLNMVDRQSQVLIATVYNDANDITKQIHTICITKDVGKEYVLHNTYRRDKNGAYTASAPYATLEDAVSHSSRYGAKLIYLIGIAVAE